MNLEFVHLLNPYYISFFSAHITYIMHQTSKFWGCETALSYSQGKITFEELCGIHNNTVRKVDQGKKQLHY